MIDHASLHYDTVEPAIAENDAPGGRLIVVSNRVLQPEQTHAGGLGQAMRTLLDVCGGVWVGWSGGISDDCSVRRRRHGRVEFVTTDLAEDDYAGYYGRFANGALWPLLHGRVDLLNFDADALAAYQRVNARFADIVARELRPDDTVWVHDYHLLPLAALLRERGFRGRIGFFLHTSVTSGALLATLPRHAQVFGALADYDLVGVQTPRDARALRTYMQAEFGGIEAPGGMRLRDGRMLRLAVFPIGVDAHMIAAQARLAQRRDAVCELRASLGDRALLIGVDRLDYTRACPSACAPSKRCCARRPS